MNPQTTSVKHETPGMFYVGKPIKYNSSCYIGRIYSIVVHNWYGGKAVSCWPIHDKPEHMPSWEVGQLFGGN